MLKETHKNTTKLDGLLYQKKSYKQITTYLDKHWKKSNAHSILKINKLLNDPASNITATLITGASGKGLTTYYATKLLQSSGYKVGAFCSPHVTHYNERLLINNQQISNKLFTKFANEVLSIIHTHKIDASSKDILTAVSLLLFKHESVDVAFIEQAEYINYDPIAVYQPSIIAITKIIRRKNTSTLAMQNNIFSSIKAKRYVIAAEPSKILLQKIVNETTKKEAIWIVPIRKLAPLPYPYGQLHGRCAALAERIAQTYAQYINKNKQTVSLISTEKKQRGRPRTSSKKQEAAPCLKKFWQEQLITIPYRFQIIKNPKSTIILDNAHVIDELENLFLGIRLLNYQNPFKKVFLIFGCQDQYIDEQLFLKNLQYLFKTVSGQVAFCKTVTTIGEQVGKSWNPSFIIKNIANTKIKASSYDDFSSAYKAIEKELDDPSSLLVITGSQKIISQYLEQSQ